MEVFKSDIDALEWMLTGAVTRPESVTFADESNGDLKHLSNTKQKQFSRTYFFYNI